MKKLVLISFLAAGLNAQAEPLRVAVVGLRHGHVWGHLPKLLAGGPVTLVGIGEDMPPLIKRARELGAAESLFHADWRKMVETLKPELVWSFAETNRHREIVEFCAPRKINVIFEKPLAATYVDARAIQTLARKHAVQVMTNWPVAWWPAIMEAKKQVDAGLIGPVWRLHAVCSGAGGGGKDEASRIFFDWLHDPKKNGGGSLMDFGSYSAAWSVWLMGNPQWVMAQALYRQPERFSVKIEDHATMLLGYANGVSVLEGSWSLPVGARDATITGTTGVLEMNKDKLIYRNGRSAKDLPTPDLAPERADPISYVVSVLRSGKPAGGLLSLELNVAAVEILDAAKRSIQSGQPVRLPLE